MIVETVADRTVRTLNRIILAKERLKMCRNPDCPLHRRYLHAHSLRRTVLPYMTFGLDIVLEVADMRRTRHLTIDEVKDRLNARGVEVSRAEVPVLERKFYALVACIQESQVARVREALRDQGGYVMTIDGTMSNGSRTLYIIRDALSGYTLSAFICREDAESIAHHLREAVKRYGKPLAVVSDMEKAVLEAVAQVMPETRHQICHFHFLKSVGKALMEETHRELKRAFKKKSRV